MGSENKISGRAGRIGQGIGKFGAKIHDIKIGCSLSSASKIVSAHPIGPLNIWLSAPSFQFTTVRCQRSNFHESSKCSSDQREVTLHAFGKAKHVRCLEKFFCWPDGKDCGISLTMDAILMFTKRDACDRHEWLGVKG